MNRYEIKKYNELRKPTFSLNKLTFAVIKDYIGTIKI